MTSSFCNFLAAARKSDMTLPGKLLNGSNFESALAIDMSSNDNLLLRTMPNFAALAQ